MPDLRPDFERALLADLVGPYSLDPSSTETLAHAPLRWYLAGFLAPDGTKPDDPSLEEENEEAGDDTDEGDSAASDGAPKTPRRLPSSMGLTVFVAPGVNEIVARASWGEYTRHEDEKSKQVRWHRSPSGPHEVRIPLDAGGETTLPNKVVAIWQVEAAPAGSGLPVGARVVNVFLVNRRDVQEGEALSASCVFQVGLEVRGELASRENHRGEGSLDTDEAIADLQYRDIREWTVGHGVGAEVLREGDRAVGARSVWIPSWDVPRVEPRSESTVTVEMDALASLANAADVQRTLGSLPDLYAKWIARQAELGPTLSEPRRETLDTLLRKAKKAAERIRRGIDILATDEQARRAFVLANRAMANARKATGTTEPPRWRLFQLAFVLLCIDDMVHARQSTFRDQVDLIFFPTGGGKTEAYLGLVAFTLVLRRLHGQSRPDGGLGVTVLLRYTLRLLTLDQLGRAATLICALELLRQKSPAELGAVRFAVGLWVGRSASANTIEDFQEQNRFFRDGRGGASPCPLPVCPWCGTPFDGTSFTTQTKPFERVITSCAKLDCPFNTGRNPEGVPIVFVDEPIYRELPCFVVATVDKLAMLPWRGATAKLFGRATSREGGAFYGRTDDAKGATKLPEGLPPPELIIQDELHLISGPLGTMVGLYETAVLELCTRDGVGPKIIASTATVRRADAQCKALYGRGVRVFPPPGPTESDTYFSEVDRTSLGRRYVGVAASGRAMKALLLRTYVALLGAAEKHFADDPEAADPYQTLVGYFNSLRELGGMRRLLEDDVRERSKGAEALRMPADSQPPHRWLRPRFIENEPVELTSRQDTATIAEAKDRLRVPRGKSGSVDVVLASNMISVGVDIDRLGLMVIAGQPKTASEYIQASSRVGRKKDKPGLVVTAFNVHKPRDRSHYERFANFHESFYRAVEATSVTPFAEPALERGLVGALVTMIRLGDEKISGPKDVVQIAQASGVVDRAIKALATRARVAAEVGAEDALATDVERMARNLVQAWATLVAQGDVKRYGKFEKGTETPLFHMALDADAPKPPDARARFRLPTSMRDVEESVPLWLTTGTLAEDDRGE
jgi:hypothetical protein